jgi:hypothetical protein
MNRIDMATRLQNYFNNPIYYTGIDLNDSIQDGLDEVVAFSGCVYNSATVPFQANLTYYNMRQLLPDYLGVIAIFNNVIKRWLLPTSLRKLNQDRIDWECVGGTPYYFSAVNHRFVAIYRKPLVSAYGNMFIYYRATAPLLNDQTLIPIPDDHLTTLENYSIADLLEQQQEWSKAGERLETYMKDLEQLRVYMRNKRDPERMMSLR